MKKTTAVTFATIITVAAIGAACFTGCSALENKCAATYHIPNGSGITTHVAGLIGHFAVTPGIMHN